MANNDGEDGYSYLPTLADELRDCGMPGEDEDDMSDVADLLFGAVPSATSGAGRASAATGAGRGRGRGRGNAAGAGAAGRGRGAPAVAAPGAPAVAAPGAPAVAAPSAPASTAPSLSDAASLASSASNSKRRSPVWKHYDEVHDTVDGEDRCFAVCKLCKSRLSATSANGTGRLKRHHTSCQNKSDHASMIQTRLALNPDGL
ncbi:hypothetical protein SORBI_3007G156000 [Sorghum bicolor]|uniref:BED-type domain-containing protein n=1 Tax=Sorghum bicolor TaxID=4558 RepID=A0A1B6PI71_SORBI|nr:hypothetical protein SORBI_3007G156000 [Sorghum bicolor]